MNYTKKNAYFVFVVVFIVLIIFNNFRIDFTLASDEEHKQKMQERTDYYFEEFSNAYDSGQCTWYAKARRPEIPVWGLRNAPCPETGARGHGRWWLCNAVNAGLPVGSQPRQGAIVVWNIGTYGHVGYVEEVYNNDSFKISEFNYVEAEHYSERIINNRNGLLGFIYSTGELSDNTIDFNNWLNKDKRQLTNPVSSGTYPIDHLGWLDVMTPEEPQSLAISAGNYDGGSRDGLHFTADYNDRGIFYHEVWWDTDERRNGRMLERLYRMDRGKGKVSAMVSGDFMGDGRDYLAVAYEGDDRIYFHINDRNNSGPVGSLDPHPGIKPTITSMAVGDIDHDGKEELMTGVSTDDHIYIYDYWNGWTFTKKLGYLDAHEQNPSTVDIATMDIDYNGYDELLVATNADDHIYVYYFDESKVKNNLFSHWRDLSQPFVKQGYIDAHEGGNPEITDIEVGNFKSPVDHLAVATSGDDHVYFYWGRDLQTNPYGKIFKQKQFKDVVVGQNNPIIGMAAGDFDESGDDELATINEGDDHVNFLGSGAVGRIGHAPDVEQHFSAKTISQSDKQIILRPGEVREVWAEFENTGSATWFTNSNPEIKLYLEPQNQNSIFDAGWDQTNSPTKLKENEITPGEKSRFKFKIWSSIYSGSYTEKFNLYAGSDKLEGAELTLDILIDAEPPEKITNLRVDESESFWYLKYTNDNTPSFLWDKAKDNESGVDGYYLALNDPTPDGYNDTDWFIGDVDRWGAESSLSDGWHTVAVTTQDKAGNVNPKNSNILGDAPYLKFMVDTIAPTTPTGLTGETTRSNWVGDTTNNRKPYLTWGLSTDDGSGVRKYIIENENENGDVAIYEISHKNFTKNKYWRVPDYLTGGDYTLRIKAMDNAGNYSDVASYNYKVDIAGPIGSVEINDNDQFTNNQDVKLKINASDESNITQYKVSNNNSTWTTFDSSNSNTLNISNKSWQLLPGDGTRTVYVKFKDALGNWSNTYSDEIILDITKPQSGVNDLPAWQNTLDFVVSWFGTDNLSGIMHFDVQYKDSVINNWVNWLTNTKLTQKVFSGLDGVTYWFRSKSTDKAENTEDYNVIEDTETTVDVSMPAAPTIDSPVANSTLNSTVDENLGVIGVQVTVSGTGEVGGDILLDVNGATYNTIVDGAGDWIVLNVLLSEGENILNATITDLAGNSNDSGDHKVWLDTIKPDAINDLAVDSITYNQAQISWTAPGDDGSTGTAIEYDIRYSLTPITALNFNTVTQVTSPPAPELAGTSQNVVVNSLISKETYYFAIKTKDNANNWSDISNVPSDTTKTSADSVVLISDKSVVAAEGIQIASLTATVYDPSSATGAKLAGENVIMTMTNDNGVVGETGSLSSVTDNGNGTYSATYTSATKVGDGRVTIETTCSTCMSTQTSSVDIDLIPGNPAGVITLTPSPAEIDADGVSASNVVSGMIYDQSGNQVADGALVTVSSTLGNITNSDEDAITPGVQVSTLSGIISFSVQSEIWNGYGVDKTNANLSATSVAGTASGATTLLMVDITAPAKPVITTPVNNFITNDNTPIITGQAEKNSRILVYKKQGAGAWQYHYYTNANSSGNFSYTFGSSLADGAWSFRVRSRDTASNDSVYSDPIAITIDTVKPTISGALPASGTYYHRTETVSANYADNAGGTGIDASSAVLKINGATKSASVTASSLSYPNTSPDSHGPYNVYVEVSDKAGNKQTKTWTFNVQIYSYFYSEVGGNYKVAMVANWPHTNGVVPSPNWWDMTFNDSAWTDGVFAANQAPVGLTKADVNSDWIWGDASVDANETSLIRHRFNIPAGVNIDDAAIRLSAENEAWGYAGYVNGTHFGKVPEALSGNNPHVFGLLPFLQTGQNLLAIQVSNDGDNSAGLSYSMTVKYHD